MQTNTQLFEQIKEYITTRAYGVPELNEVWGRLSLRQKNELLSVIREALEEMPNEAVQEWASMRQATTPVQLGDTGYFALVPRDKGIIASMSQGITELRSTRGILSDDELPPTANRQIKRRLAAELAEIQRRTVAPAPPAANEIDEDTAWFYEVSQGVEPISKDQAYQIYRQDISNQNRSLQLEAYLAAVVNYAKLYDGAGNEVTGGMFMARKERGITIYKFNPAIAQFVRRPTREDFEVSEDTNALRERLGLTPLAKRRPTNETEQRLVWLQIAADEWTGLLTHAIAMLGYYGEALSEEADSADTDIDLPAEVDPKQGEHSPGS